MSTLQPIAEEGSQQAMNENGKIISSLVSIILPLFLLLSIVVVIGLALYDLATEKQYDVLYSPNYYLQGA